MAGSRQMTMYCVMEPDLCQRLAQAVLDAYQPRFEQCLVRTHRSAHNDIPLGVTFWFIPLAQRDPKGVIVELDS